MEEFAHTAFYRHLNDKTGVVCPGKCSRLVSYAPNDEARSIDDETGNFDPLLSELDMSFCSEMSDNHLETTFDFGSESDNSCHSSDSDNDVISLMFLHPLLSFHKTVLFVVMNLMILMVKKFGKILILKMTLIVIILQKVLLLP